jgi:hypothetical protein
MAQRFYIGQINGQGLQTDLKPFAIPDDAFAELNNAYVFRGRVRKRFGARLMRGTDAQISGLEQIQSRLKINIGTTNAVTGNFSGTVPGSVFKIGQAFSIGSQFFTVYQTGTPANMLKTGAATVATYNTNTGAVVINGAALNTTVYFYPAEPVMGLRTYEQSEINVEQVIAFDTQFAYQFAANGWERISAEATAGAALWTGSNSDFFWSTNWRGATSSSTVFFVTNYNTGADLTDSDRMRYYNGTQWANFQPGFSASTATNTILSARIILPFKDRLLLLNVVENTGAGPGTNATYVNRCRFSWNGDPFNATAFYEDISGAGGYIDAPTKEAIITAQFLKDRLIVFFEDSTWELAYTGNQVLPFVWQQINTELGAESTFSQVPFDKFVLGVGNVGIHSCSGTNVERIDQKIPDEVFKIHNNNQGPQRVGGIRDYYTEMVYWTFPDENRSDDYPYNNKVLTYNYKNNCWGFNDDSITAFGYFQTTVSGTLTGLTWGGSNSFTWDDSDFPWNYAASQAKFRNVIAGNQEGYTFIIDPDMSVNSQSLQINNMDISGAYFTELKVTNHNLSVGDFVKIEDAQGVTQFNDLIFRVYSVTDNGTFHIDNNGITPTGTYTGAGTLTRVTPIDFKTKQFNFFANSGRNTYVQRVDFLVDRTENGECTVDFGISSSPYGQVFAGTLTNSKIGTYVLETRPYALAPFENQQDRLWHPVYFQADGEYVQFFFSLSDSQALDVEIAEADFQLHAMVIHAQPTSYRLQ